MPIHELLLTTTIAFVIYALYTAWRSLRTLDNLIWTHLQYDPEGTNRDLSHSSLLANQTAQVALRYLGITESPRGSNRGPHIDDFLRFVGLQPGNPWCTAFVCYCVHKAAEELGIQTDFPKTAWTPTLLAFAKQKNILITQAEIAMGVRPQRGWVFMLYYPNLKRVAHSGIVLRTLPAGLVLTIEGNTNNDGSREGYKVARRIRRLKSIYAFIPT